MDRRKPQVVVLCEDLKQSSVMYHFLKCHGILESRIRVKKSPVGRGAADQYVLEQFPRETKAYRSKCNHMNICLLVIVDADPHNRPSDRFDTLAQTLRDAGMNGLRQDEKIAILVPKRNIETWMHHLLGHQTDEHADYKRLHPHNECKPAGQRLKDIGTEYGTSRALPEDIPDSLASACQEIHRICTCQPGPP